MTKRKESAKPDKTCPWCNETYASSHRCPHACHVPRALTKSRPGGLAASATVIRARPGLRIPSEHWCLVNPTMRHT